MITIFQCAKICNLTRKDRMTHRRRYKKLSISKMDWSAYCKQEIDIDQGFWRRERFTKSLPKWAQTVTFSDSWFWTLIVPVVWVLDENSNIYLQIVLHSFHHTVIGTF